MRTRFTLVSLLILIVLCADASAVTVDYLNTGLQLSNDGSAKVKLSFSADTTSMDGILIPLRDAQVLNVNDGEYNLKYAWVDSGLLVKVEKHRPNYQINMEYITTKLTTKTDDRWSMVYMPLCSEKFTLKENSKTAVLLSLPRDSILISFEPEGMIFTENNILRIGWKIEPSNSSRISADYRTSAGVPDGGWKGDLIKSLMLIFMASVLLLISGTWFLNRYVRKVSPAKKMIMDTLEKREALVVRFLIENLNSRKREISQSQIQKHLNLSKATLSRTVRRLKEKGIIDVQPLGTTNLVKFSNGFLKK